MTHEKDLGVPLVSPAGSSPIAEPSAAVPSAAARALTLGEEALLEYGKTALIQSVANAIEFHKTMLGITATFGTLLTTLPTVLVWTHRDVRLPNAKAWVLAVPMLLMLSSSIAFALGYYPRSAALNPNIIESITDVRERGLLARRRLASIGVGFFVGSLLLMMCLLIWLRSRVVG